MIERTRTFLKNRGVRYELKKAMVLSRNDVIRYDTEAPDDKYLMTKVALVLYL